MFYMTKGTPKESDINKKRPNKDNRHYLAIEISEKEKTYTD